MIPEIDQNDEKALREASSADASSLHLYTADGQSLSLQGWFKGKSAFLVLCGPSLEALDLNELRRPGIVTMGVNNIWSLFRPMLWTGVDRPGNFLDTGWKDASVIKLVPLGHLLRKNDKRLRVKRRDGTLHPSKLWVSDMPSCLYYRRNEKFNPDTYLDEPSVNWGCHAKVTDPLGYRGCRSVMLAAVRLLYYLGIRRLYLVGADFKMEKGGPNYAFPQSRTASSVSGNNRTFKALNARFDALRPHFERRGFHVCNCLKGSGLQSFPHVPFAEAVARASKEASKAVSTDGWYDKW
ncbi:MAG: hypothetical protein V3T83_06770 [Acidobacteriota bacterium]